MIFNNLLSLINNSYVFSKKRIRSLYLSSNIYNKKIIPSIVSSLEYYPSPNLLDSLIKYDKKKINIENYSLNKIWDNKELKKIKSQKNLEFDIEIDGGINFDNNKLAIDAGANILVSGTTVFRNNNGNIKKNIDLLKSS